MSCLNNVVDQLKHQRRHRQSVHHYLIRPAPFRPTRTRTSRDADVTLSVLTLVGVMHQPPSPNDHEAIAAELKSC